MNREERRARLRARYAEIRAEFNGKYKDELKALQGLSRDEIDSITPGTADREIYLQLIAAVEAASAQNISQAELLEDIQELGDIAIEIVKKVPVLVGKIGL
ncbi:MAG: hypothetical protein N4A74_15285 [Carboxylicivirga sp.]|jgi:hypothetical protein|nr:hypothetical protein [Carboxylicivirga sp.]